MFWTNLLRMESNRVEVFALVFFLLVLSNKTHAASCEPWVAKAISVQGSVERRSTQTGTFATKWLPIKRNEIFCAGDLIRVNQNSRAALLLNNDTLLRLDQNTTISLTGLLKNQSQWINLQQGIAHFIARIKQSFTIITPFLNAGVEGTEFVVSVNANQSEVTVFEGKVKTQNKLGETTLITGQTAVANNDIAPTIFLKIKPRDAVQWSIYYPAIVNYDTLEYDAFESDIKKVIAQSIAAAQAGQVTTAIARINSLPSKILNATLLIYRASLYLLVGRINLAKQDIQNVIQKQTDNAQAIALQAIIAIVQSDKTRALSLAEQAATLEPNSASTALALSYVYQSIFDIHQALEVIQISTTKNINNALLWSRLSELYLMEGELDKALEAAKQANALNPFIARTYSALGFAYLTKIDVKKAEQAFNNAITRDDTDPLSRLGLGLASIRQGDLTKGRQQIEFAATIDPNNALIRSYLGKAYFEEHRNRLARTQYEMAKQLDPKDPTSYFYDAIRKQSENQPLDALLDLQTSIKLNDNKAVYRSKFFLENDNAIRSSNLGRIYKDLGFENTALVTGWKSVNSNPLNFSAHKLLADSYSSLARHEFARINELFISQLLQTPGISNSHPQESVANLGVIDGTGISDHSSGDFNPLFERNGNLFQFDAVYGSNNTYGSSIIFSNLEDKTSFNAGYYFYKTDGFRENNDQLQEIFSINTHSKIYPNTNLRVDFRNTKVEKGDLPIRATGDFTTNLRQLEDIDTFRLSLAHSIQNNSVLLSSIAYQNADIAANYNSELTFTSSADFYIADILNIHKTISYNISSGMTYRKMIIDNQDIIFGNKSTSQFNTKFYNAYFYLNYIPTPDVLLSIAGSFDSLQDSQFSEDKDKFNPKLGFIWNPSFRTTIRSAYIETVQRPRVSGLTTDPSLEPTQVAGFNQYYFATEGEEAELSGVAIEQKFNNRINAGIEVIYRNTKQYIFSANFGRIKPIWKENTIRGYFYSSINKQFSLSIEYINEMFNRKFPLGIIGIEEFTKIGTTRIPIKLSYFSQYGVTFSMKATNIDQNGDYVYFSGNHDTINIKDQFWVYDTSISYLLPHRKGIISLEVKNITNNIFVFQDTDPRTPQITSERYIMIRLNLSL